MSSVIADATLDGNAFPITEVPGQRATREQLSMFLTRYRFVRPYCADKDVLEIACGGGQGLGYLARVATSVTGGDIDERVLAPVRARYRDRGNIDVRALDAHALPFAADSFDVVAILDAIYWMRDQRRCFQEARRVLRRGGVLIVSTVNRHWAEFCPSPYATTYLDAEMLVAAADREGMRSELYAAFPAAAHGLKHQAIGVIRRAAVTLGVVPKSIKHKEMLKRVFFGRLTPIPDEVTDDMAPYSAPQRVQPAAVGDRFKLLYLVACRD